MKVFVYQDIYRHIGVYDIDSPEQIQIIFGKIIKDFGGNENEIEKMELSEIYTFIQDRFDFCFNKSGGNRAYIVDIKKQMDQFVEN